jgi:FkbM family methyltransferase
MTEFNTNVIVYSGRVPNFNINYEPRFTKDVVKQNLLKNHELVILEVGARGGVDKCWDSLGNEVKIYAFEPDREECIKLNEKNDKSNIKYIPIALAEKCGIRNMFINHLRDGSSFYQTNDEYVDKFQMGHNLKTQKVVQVETMDLIEVCRRYEIPTFDVVKLDAEGAELEILKGGGELIREACTVVSELRLTDKLNGSPPFSHLMDYMNINKFELYDLDIYRFSRKVLPTPFLYDFRDSSGEKVPGPTISGQMLSGDALFFNDDIGKFKSIRILKYIILLEIFGLNDVAIELLLKEKEKMEQILSIDEALNLLTPRIGELDYSYQEYSRLYEINNSFFRPKSGFRYRESIYKHYE